MNFSRKFSKILDKNGILDQTALLLYFALIDLLAIFVGFVKAHKFI